MASELQLASTLGMPAHPLTVQILKNYYPLVLTLREYIFDVAHGVSLVAADDAASYTALLDSCFVATGVNDTPLLSFEAPSCTQSEVRGHV